MKNKNTSKLFLEYSHGTYEVLTEDEEFYVGLCDAIENGSKLYYYDGARLVFGTKYIIVDMILLENLIGIRI